MWKMNRQYIFTERAHLMCPNMYFGIVVTVNRQFDRDALAIAFQKLSHVHPFLNALLGYETKDNQYYYDVTDSSKIEVEMKDVEVSSMDDPAIWEEYEKKFMKLFGRLREMCKRQ